MGCVSTITYDSFPKQTDENCNFPLLGERVKVFYHYDISKVHMGYVVRADSEPPFEIIIKLDNGRYVRANECQFSCVDEQQNYQKPKGSDEYMSKVKISINSAQSSIKINDQEINDIVTDLSVNIRATQSPTITMTLVPCKLEINGESFDVKSPTSTPKEQTKERTDKHDNGKTS